MFTPSEEQIIIKDNIKAKKNVAIIAYAGTGKTTTLEYVTKQVCKPAIYLAFNKDIATEASGKFPEYVTCSTIHSLAYKNIIRYPKSQMGVKLTRKYNKIILRNLFVEYYSETINEINVPFDQLDEPEQVYQKKLINTVITLITWFCQSAESDIYTFADERLTYALEYNEISNIIIDDVNKNAFLTILCKYWNLLIDPKTKEATITDDIYLKLFQLNKPNLNIPLLLLDECLTNKHFVKTEQGCIAIKSLVNKYNNKQKVPKVLSYNLDKNIYEYKNIIGALESHNRETVDIVTEGLNKISCTGNHKILTQRGWVIADELQIGKDYILLDSSENQKSKKILNEDQLQVVLGSYLGDGYLEKRSNYNTYRLKLTQGIQQLNYLLHKANLFQIDNIQVIKSGYTNKINIYTAQSKTFILPDTPWNLLQNMDARALAIWYMDDGSISQSNNIILHANKFDDNEIIYLLQILFNNFNLVAQNKKTSKGHNYITFNKENGTKLLDLISQYIHKDLYNKHPAALCNYIWNNQFKPYGANYITNITKGKIQTVYDLTVEDNHNFITTRTNNINSVGCIVHNCQDSNDVTLDIFFNQEQYGTQLVLVGDPYQSIYAWRGATNAMDKIPESFTKCYLTTSYRFTPEIAIIASNILKKLDAKKDVKGFATFKQPNNQKAILVRSNLEGLKQIINYCDDYKVHSLADYKEAISILYHIASIYSEKEIKYPAKEYKHISTIKDLELEAKTDKDLKKYLDLYFRLNSSKGIYNVLSVLKNKLVDKKEDADIVIATTHKAKGLEWDEVTIAEDYIPQGVECTDELLQQNQLGNMLYVAITRAKYRVNIPENVLEFIEG